MPISTFRSNCRAAEHSLLRATLNSLLPVLLIAGLGVPVSVSGQTANYFNGFEVDITPGWDAFGGAFNPTRVSSGTNGITSSTGSWHAQVGTDAATNFGGFHSVFPTCGYKTSVDIYLNVSGGWANDTRVDYTSAISNIDGTHRRDFAFSIGFYNDNDGLGAGTYRFILSRSFNTPGWPKNPANPKFMVNQTGWYRFEHTFRSGAGGVLEVDLKVYQILANGSTPQVGSTFMLSDPSDIIGSTVGGNRYGWILNNGFSTLAIDNSYLWPVSLVTNLNTMNTYCTIQAAVNAASDNDVLEVSEGISNERVTINRPLTLKGVGESQCIVYGAGLAGNGRGIAINNAITGVTIKKLTIQNFAGASGNADAGIYAIGGNNNLLVENVTIQNNVGGSGFYANGPVNNVTLNYVTSSGHTVGARGIVIWNGVKSNITITNCTVFGNNCCGIELQDGAASGVTMNNNNVYNNGDNGIGLIGLDGTVGPNVISNNTLLNNGRFGMEIKNPNGATTISNNSVTRNVAIVDLRDIAGIAIHRRGVLAPPNIVNVDVPTGVTVTGNTVSGYVQTSDSDGFGIVVEGTFHTVTSNTVSGNDVGIQQQAGHTPYPADGNQNNIPDQYFGRGNAQTTCGNTISGNTLTNTVNTRNVGTIGLGLVTNTTTTNTYCTIQAAVTAASPGDDILVSPGTYNENVTINKSLTLRSSGGKGVTTITGSNVGPLATISIQASNVTIGGFGQGFKINGYDSPSAGIEYAAVYVQGVYSNVTIRDNEIFADGEAGLLTNVGQAVTNLVVNANIFSGKTFVGAEAGDCGFGNQFTAFNVPRQLVVIQTGSGIIFTSNSITGTAGSTSSVSGCTTFGQGNTLVTIDANDATIKGNTFAGITTRFGSSLRVRGTNASIYCNTFNNAGLGAACTHVTFNATSLGALGTPNTVAGIADQNTFVGGGAYLNPLNASVNIYRDNAQATAEASGGQVVVDCNAIVLPKVTNTNTGEKFCSIQSAIDDANTLNGHTISVVAGTFAENVVVNKSLTINGPNANIACGSRVAEAIIAPGSGLPFSVTVDGVSINGFEITAPSYNNAISCGSNGTSNLAIKYNRIHDIGITYSGGPVHAIQYTLPAASRNNVSITDNCFDNISSTSLTGNSASAIGILQSTSTGVLTSLNIERNTINDVQVNTGNWPTGKIAYGIIINVGGSGSYLTTSGEVVDAVIRNNVISNVSGFIATGIALEGNTKNAFVENNSVATLYGRKVDVRVGGGYDLNALKFESNRYVGTCTVQNNSFQTNTFTHDVTAGLGYAVANFVPAGVAFTGGGGGTTGEVTLSCNWYGTAVYSDIIDNPALNGKIFNKVNCVTNFVPYLVNGTDNAPAIGFQPHPTACSGGPVQVYNGPTFVSVHATIQGAIDAVTTLNGHTLRIISGTYTENVDAATGGKNLKFAPGASPGCVNIVGNMTLNAGDVLEIEIDAATACTGYDQFTVSGTVTLGGATLTIPAGAYFPVTGDMITIIDGSNPIVGMFAQGNFVTDGNGHTYYISYAGNDVVLTKCCGALIDIGIYNHTAPTPAGNKLQVKLRPNVDVINGSYSGGVFAIRTLTSNGVTFTNLGSAFGYSQVPTDPMPPYDPITLTDGLYSYYFFSFASVFTGRNWLAGQDTLALTLGYSCVGNATFELINDAFAIANGAQYFQELGGQNATGIFLPAATTATSPVSVSIVATNNGPLCTTMPIDLNSTTSNGSPASPPPPYTYVWAGPDTYTNNVADPATFVSTLAKAGIYTVTVTDGNGCTATGTTNVVVLANGGCVKNVDLTTYYPTITQAINVPETINGHTLEVPAGNWPENVNVTKALKIKGANVGIPCTGSRVAESIIMGTTAVTIASNGVTIDGFQIEGITGVSSAGYTKDTIRNNKVNALFMGITSSLVVTTPTDGYVIQDNCIDLADQTYDTQGFATNPTLAATQTPGAWYVDRFAPAGFVSDVFGGSNRLKHSILQSQTQGDAFYNTQGRKYDIAGSKAMNIQLFVPAAWATTGRRMAGFWGTAVDGSNVVTRYPIIEFTSDGANPRFRVYDNGTWIDLGLPTGFAYNQWYTLQIALLSNGAFLCSVGDRSTTISGGGSVSIANAILQGYNHTPGLDYDIYWDNFNAFDNPVAQNAPTVGVALVAAAGTQAVVLQSNSVSDAFYGHLLNYVTTTPRTTVRGGTHTNLMQGVAVVNTIDFATYSPSTVGVDNVNLTSFGGDYPAIPGANFHAGVYVFTGGANPLDTVNILVDSVTVSNTGKIAPDCAGLSFADFSTGAGNRLRAVVTESFVTNNLNRGVNVRGANALAIFKQDSIGGNGADPHGTGGNNGFGVYAGVGATVILDSNFITNPPTQAGIYPVTAMFIGVAPAAKITAFNNSINRNGNGSLTANTYPIAQFTATCNWWGNGLIDAVDALVDGNVLFVPYLNIGTDNSVARGFQPLGLCANPKRWYVNDLALTDDVFTLGLGDDLNQGTKRRPFRTIGKAIMSAVTADTVYADAGMYNEQNIVPNTKDNMHFIGVGPCTAVSPALTTMVDFTGTVTGKPTLFDIAGDGTVIDGIHFKVDLSKFNSAIIATDLDPLSLALDNITIKNNCIDPYHSVLNTYFGSYGNRNAISINYGGSTNYRMGGASGGVNNIIVDNNRVTATVFGPILGDSPGDIGFRSAVSVDEGAGTYTRNTFQSINHDILVRFNSNGPVVIGGSVANANTFLGGGVQYSDPNAGGGAVTISRNTFNGLVSGSVLRLQDNYHNAPVTVSYNTLTNLRWGISLENFRNVTVDSNIFTPLAGYTTFRHITVNTKTLASDTMGITPQQINGVFTRNTFNALGSVGGTAMAFYNHRLSPMNLGTFTVGTTGNPNVFAPNFLWAVYLGDQSGPTIPAPVAFPEYDLGANSETTMACWYRDINIEKNTFDIGSGAQYPQFMNHAQRLALEAILWHMPDNICLGELIYYNPVELIAKVFLQGPFDSASGLMYDSLRLATPTILIPSAEPYTAINTAFPTSFTKVNNFVTESGVAGSVFLVTGPNAIVDWVWLELRDKTNNTVVLATRSALVQRDGDIVDLDGTSAVLFPDSYADDYFVLVRHRNHLGAMTAAAVNLAGAHFVDFTVATQPTFGATATSARKLIKTATYGLIAGNTLPKIGGGYQIIYNNADNDRASILTAVGASTPLNTVYNVYMLQDVNMDRKVRYNNAGNDRVIILNNVGASTPLNIITQQPNF